MKARPANNWTTGYQPEGETPASTRRKTPTAANPLEIPARLPGTYIAAHLRAGAGLGSRLERERDRLSVLCEDGFSSAEDERLDREQQLVDQVGLEQRPHHRRAAVHVDVAARPRAQIGHCLDQISAADDGRGLPHKVLLGERIGHHVLLHAV